MLAWSIKLQRMSAAELMPCDAADQTLYNKGAWHIPPWIPSPVSFQRLFFTAPMTKSSPPLMATRSYNNGCKQIDWHQMAATPLTLLGPQASRQDRFQTGVHTPLLHGMLLMGTRCNPIGKL